MRGVQYGVLALTMLVVSAGCSESTSADTTATTGPSAPTTTSTAAPTTTTTQPAPTTTAPTTTSLPPTTTTTLPTDPLLGLGLDILADGFSRPTYVTALPGDDTLVVVEAVGRIHLVDATGDVQPEPFLNIRNKVGSVSIEQGLLGLAFHPGFAGNGRFFVYYTDRDDDSILAEYRHEPGTNQVDATSERVLLTIPQPDVRHNAGMLQFGPDGYLYVATGDGGAGGASVNGQDPATLLAAILRIDVDSGDPYGIPSDNPFAAGGGAPEVWAYGLRNPWRFAIDAVDNVIYIGDVGQESREEINAVPLAPAGYNFGWPAVEGTRCFLERACEPSDYVLPVLDYPHDEGLSVTGGYPYRGAAIPELTGHYFYADWVREWIRSFRLEDGVPGDERDWTADLRPGQINSFGIDGAGELLVATWDGRIGRIVPIR